MRSRSAGSAAGGRRPAGAMEGLPEELVQLVCVCVCVRARAPPRARVPVQLVARAPRLFLSLSVSLRLTAAAPLAPCHPDQGPVLSRGVLAIRNSRSCRNGFISIAEML